MAEPGSFEQEGTPIQIPRAIVPGGQGNCGNDHSVLSMDGGLQTNLRVGRILPVADKMISY
jgi:hypothetical protein